MRHGKIYRRMAGGPKQRIHLLRNFLTALVKFERFEAPYAKAHETQKYAERLINIAKKGDTDSHAMKIADFWLTDKKQIHKLFKVLVPRFASRERDYTQLLMVPGYHEKSNVQTAFLEFHGNPYPALRPVKKQNPDWILNILVRGATEDLKSTRLVGEDGAPAEVYPDSLVNDTSLMMDKMRVSPISGKIHSRRDREGTPV